MAEEPLCTALLSATAGKESTAFYSISLNRMSNRDFSHVNLAQKKAAQTQYARYVTNSVAVVKVPGFMVKGGVAPASTGVETLRTGAETVGVFTAPIYASVPASQVQTVVSNSVRNGVNPNYNIPAAIAQSL